MMTKKRCSIFLLFILLLAALLAGSMPAQAQGEIPTPAPNPCAAADNYFSAGLLNNAKDAYATVLTENPGEKCATDGLKAIGEKKCALAQTQVASNDLEGAKATYKDILTELPDLKCALDGLTALSPAACTEAEAYLKQGAVNLAETTYTKMLETQPREKCALDGLVQVAMEKCALADTQAKSGNVDGSKATYEEILKNYPNLTCAVDGQAALSITPAKIQNLIQMGNYETAWTDLNTATSANPKDSDLQKIAKEPWAFWYGVKAFFTSFYGQLVVGFVFILLVIILVLILATRPPKLDIEKLDASTIEADAAKRAIFENELKVRFERALGSQGQLRKIKNPDLIDGPLGELTLPDLGLPGPVNKYLEFLKTLLITLLRTNIVTISGFLAEDKEKGAGIFIHLASNQNKKVWGVDAVWESDVVPGFNIKAQGQQIDNNRYQALAKYAAVLTHWIYYQQKDPQKLQGVFGTQSFRSHILTRVATELQENDPQNTLVGKLLRQALTEDPDNYAAMLNLGRFTLRERPKESEKYLQRVIKMTEEHKGMMGLPHVLATYRLGANYLEAYASAPKKMQNDLNLDNAVKYLEEARTDAEKLQRKHQDITKDLVAMVQIPYADALRRQNASDPKPGKIIEEIEAEAFAAPRVLYNLACYCSENNHWDEALDYLERTFLADDKYCTQAQGDPSFDNLRRHKESKYKKLIGNT